MARKHRGLLFDTEGSPNPKKIRPPSNRVANGRWFSGFQESGSAELHDGHRMMKMMKIIHHVSLFHLS